MTILAAIVVGVGVLLAGNLLWAGFGPIPGLGVLNQRIGVAAPWAVAPMALYLWLYWKFLAGTWIHPPNAAQWRANLRANPLTPKVWIASLGAGLIGFAAIVSLLTVVARLVALPAGAPITTPPGMPAVTGFLLLVMASTVAGVSEEAAFRGYMQSMIERRHGVILAILINGIVFGLLHFGNHPRDTALMLPYYVVVSAVYGALTWAVDSILPALVLHVLGDVVVLTRWWITGRPEWQIAPAAPPLVWDGGIDRSFLAGLLGFVALAAATTFAYGRLRRLRSRR